MAREIPNIPQGIQDQLSKTPAERKAELLARRQARLDALTPQQRQKVQDRFDRISAVPVNKRPSLMQGLRLGSTARAIKARIEGAKAEQQERQNDGHLQDGCQGLFLILKVRIIFQYAWCSYVKGSVLIDSVSVISGHGWVVHRIDRDGYRGHQVAVCSSVVGEVSKGISTEKVKIWLVGKTAVAI